MKPCSSDALGWIPIDFTGTQISSAIPYEEISLILLLVMLFRLPSLHLANQKNHKMGGTAFIKAEAQLIPGHLALY